MRFALFLVLLCLAVACLGTCACCGTKDIPGRREVSGAAQESHDAEKTLSTFNETIAAVATLVWSIVTVYYLTAGNRMRGRRKTGNRRARR